METTLTRKITTSDKEFNDKLEDRRKETKKDFKDLHTKIDDNQKTIIDTINGLK